MSLGRLPFRRLDTQQWLRLAWIGLAVFYLLFSLGAVWAGRLFEYPGSDYLAFYSSAEIARTHGFAQVYDLQLQQQVQRYLHDGVVSQPFPASYAPVPTPFFPAFILLFMPLQILPLLPSFVVWTLLNAAVLLLYLRRFFSAVGDEAPPGIWLQVLLSAPMFGILFFGQVNVWMLVCFGEFLLAMRRGQDLTGGLWLAGLLIKPQALVLLLPGLLIGRRFKVLAGFSAATLGILLLSLLLAGPSGLVSLGRLILGYSSGLATNNPQVMMNWRSLAINLQPLLSQATAWGITIAGTAITALAGLAFWFRPGTPGSPRFALSMLGCYAATCAATWHSHTNLALSTIPLLLLPEVKQRLPRATFEAWFLIPALVFPPAFFIRPDLAHNLVGLSLLGLNLYLACWSAFTLWKKPRTVVGGGVDDPGHTPVTPPASS